MARTRTRVDLTVTARTKVQKCLIYDMKVSTLYQQALSLHMRASAWKAHTYIP